MSQFTIEQFRQVGISALVNGMSVVADHLPGGLPVTDVRIKPLDNTLLTEVDEKSGAAIRRVFTEAFEDVDFKIEDVGEAGSRSNIVLLGDPIDGTFAFTIGAHTSTVITAAYDRGKSQVVACAVGHSASGCIWYADVDTPTRFCCLRPHGGGSQSLGLFEEWRNVSVNPDAKGGVMSDALCGFYRPNLASDLARGFRGAKRTILADEAVVDLEAKLLKYYRLLKFGSNGYHQALVAHGGATAMGSITTAIGGPWDVAGALLVMRAGGQAIGLQLESDSTWTMVDPLNIMGYDMLITGNSEKTVVTLLDHLGLAMR